MVSGCNDSAKQARHEAGDSERSSRKASMNGTRAGKWLHPAHGEAELRSTHVHSLLWHPVSRNVRSVTSDLEKGRGTSCTFVQKSATPCHRLRSCEWRAFRGFSTSGNSCCNTHLMMAAFSVVFRLSCNFAMRVFFSLIKDSKRLTLVSGSNAL